MFGYGGKFVYIDLSIKKASKENVVESFCRKYLGGNGFGVYLLYNNSKPKIEPFSPENPLIFSVGPFAGTCIPATGKYIVNAKSPLTFLYGEGVASGSWGAALKLAGYDAAIIKGKAEKPVYIFIDDDSVQFRDAKDLWGKDSWETDSLIKEEIGDENVKVAAIGSGGEHLVRYANITNDRNRHAGRTGMGAVMGSKNLKAFAVRGTKSIQVAKLDELLSFCHQLIKDCQGPATRSYRTYGTPASMSMQDAAGVSPTKNWQLSKCPEVCDTLTAEYIKKNFAPKMIACQGCPIACDPVTVLKDGPFKGVAASVEHETLYGLGLSTGVGNYPAVTKATELCDRYGIDTITAGVTIGWAMECYEKGLITNDDTDGLELTFGNYESMLEVIRKIAYREGKIGNFLAEGSKLASEKLGKGSTYFAMHNKGLELPHYEMRALKVSTLGFCTSTRGGHHMTSSPYDLDLGGVQKIYNQSGYKIEVDGQKANPVYGKYIADREDWYSIIESLICCKFTRNVFCSYENLTVLYELVTGIPMGIEEMRETGQRIYTLEKCFNVREGSTRKDDYPPPRILNDPVPNGPYKGARLTKEEYDMMLDSYYNARSWTSEGIPTKKKLIGIGLEDVAVDIWGEKKWSKKS